MLFRSGLATGIFIHGLLFASLKSFGVPFLSPFGPYMTGKSKDALIRAPIWMQESRPDFLNTKNRKMQPEISRGWTKGKDGDDKNERK